MVAGPLENKVDIDAEKINYGWMAVLPSRRKPGDTVHREACIIDKTGYRLLTGNASSSLLNSPSLLSLS